MAGREIEPVGQNKWGDEAHPAFGMIAASRVSSAGGKHGGQVLFQSDVAHNHFVVLRISRASRKRDLHRDWVHDGGPQLIEVGMTEAQWASMISSMNTSGVPCTIMRTEKDGQMPGLDFESRLDVTHREVRAKAETALEEVKKARDAYEEKKSAANLRALHFAIENLPANFEFAAKSLTEHAEEVVQKSRADIEAMIVAKARQLGIEPSDAAELIGIEMAPAELEAAQED